ncbi:alanine/glycine:cation symporter family protein [Catenulispora pinisilvae]|uniref:alanine/glycine:cation symporter family protein n=1 Tax=Catenulispora pinisilvae TaxID=2705253 RepID=UPI0018919C03|nr:alanine/glycine:cation symporter family protein [Catenulispora pinisilvae]
MDFVREQFIDPVSHFLYTYVLIYLLIGAGLYFTARTRAVQVRLLKPALRLLVGDSSRSHSENGVSSFQAFAIGLASRVGTGNIAGVAVALTVGGPGAVFWMWVVAVVGMATGFVEATLAQLFKRAAPGGGYRGGPAYYMETGLGSRRAGAVFAVLLIFTFGIAFTMVQANTVADVLAGTHGVSAHWTGLILVVLSAPALFGGVQRVAKIAGLVLPVMAVAYLALAAVIIVTNPGRVAEALGWVFRDAFGFGPAAVGGVSGLGAAMLNGVKRGLFSNEAGMGSAPNAAATADTTHPAKQGLLQSLGVAVDTLVVCTATAMIIMLADRSVYDPTHPGSSTGASLTQAAVVNQFGDWSKWLMTVMVFVFAYSSVLGNYVYAEVNLDYLGATRARIQAFRVVVLAAVALGSLLSLQLVWEFADVAMGVMALMNLAAIVLLGRWAFGALRDYEAARAAGADPSFHAPGNEYLPGSLRTDVWV